MSKNSTINLVLLAVLVSVFLCYLFVSFLNFHKLRKKRNVKYTPPKNIQQDPSRLGEKAFLGTAVGAKIKEK